MREVKLYRTRSDWMYRWEACAREGIAGQLFVGKGFTRRGAIKDLRRILQQRDDRRRRDSQAAPDAITRVQW